MKGDNSLIEIYVNVKNSQAEESYIGIDLGRTKTHPINCSKHEILKLFKVEPHPAGFFANVIGENIYGNTLQLKVCGNSPQAPLNINKYRG